MSVTFKNAGAPVAIATNAASPAPNATTPVSGDRSFMIVTVKPNTTTVNTPTNWTHVVTHTGGNGAAQGNDAGDSKVAIFRRDDAFSGGQSMTTSGANSGSACIITLQKTLANWDAEATVNGADSTTGSANFQAGTASDPGWTAGDAMVCPISLPTDASTLTQGGTILNAAISATGISGGTTNSIYWESATGQDSGGGVIIRDGVAGTASSNPDVFATFTAAVNVVGPCIFLRQRDSGTAPIQGVATANFGFTGAAAGVPKTFGVASAAFVFTGAAAGKPFVSGVAVGNFGFTGTASGTVGGPVVTGTAQGAFGFTGTAAGTPRTFGVGAATFGFTGTAAGNARTLGVAVAGFTFTGAATGRPRHLGAALAAFEFTATAEGGVRHRGTAVGSFGFTGAASGVVGAAPVTGVAVGAYTFAGTATGQPRALGTAQATFGPTTAAQGHPRHLGQALGAYTFTGTASGVPRTLGQASAVFLFVGEAVSPPPISQGIMAGRRRLVATTSSRNRSTPQTTHRHRQAATMSGG